MLVTFALRPGNSSCSFVSSSASKVFPEKIAALKFSSIAPRYKCPVVQNAVSSEIFISSKFSEIISINSTVFATTNCLKICDALTLATDHF